MDFYDWILLCAGIGTGLYYLKNAHVLLWGQARPFQTSRSGVRPGNVPFFMPLMLLMAVGIGASVFYSFSSQVTNCFPNIHNHVIPCDGDRMVDYAIEPAIEEPSPTSAYYEVDVVSDYNRPAVFGEACMFLQNQRERQYCSRLELMHHLNTVASRINRLADTTTPSTITVSFVVEANGYVSNITIEQPLSREVAQRVRNSFTMLNLRQPRWSPAQVDGSPARSWQTVEISLEQ